MVGLATLYLGTLEDPESSTFKDKFRDLQKFLDFYGDHYGHHQAAEWYPAVSKRFVSQHLSKRLRKPGGERYAPSSIGRIWSTVRHFGRWAHREHADCFPHGSPVAGVSPPDEPEAAWVGLRPKDLDRLVTAAHALKNRPPRTGGTNQGLRDLAFLHVLIGSGLRVSELTGLDAGQYDGRYFLDVVCKGGVRRPKVFVHHKDNRVAIDEWLAERGSAGGPLFCTRVGKQMSRSQAFGVIKRMERQANAHLPEEERFLVSPHVLRHTLGRQLAEDKGERFARKQLGHRSGRQLYRYIQPSVEDLEELFD
ncbi:MAG: tyrosine-type recombinase/integrase [bacterium]|nr:tyrosine-type recombinase/integrase [bacterium]